MDRVFSASREAYQSGDGAKAKDLSNKGKQMKERQERLNREAADWIFESTFLNSGLRDGRLWDGMLILFYVVCVVGNNSAREPGEIDLHGLRAEEAVERTEWFIDECRQKGITELRLIVGELHGCSLFAI